MDNYNRNIEDESMVIYAFKNKINGKMYVGQTRRTFGIRTKQHLNRSDTYFDKALAKYGLNNFSYWILDRGSTLEELNEKERYWIAEYDCLWPNGYNLTVGGDGVKGYRHTGEYKRKMSEAKKGKMIGENNPFYGKKHTIKSIKKCPSIKVLGGQLKQEKNLAKVTKESLLARTILFTRRNISRVRRIK